MTSNTPSTASGSTASDSQGSGNPGLYSDRSFWGMAVTQFLGAFNDNLFKFLILLLVTPTAQAIAAGEEAKDLQSEAMIIFASAFMLFSGFAGYLADKTSKRTIIVAAKIAEIFVMLAGMIGFYYFDSIGIAGMMLILFFMGLQSTFFGPAKYGILPEMLREEDLPRANGIILTLTFLAIIFGSALAGILLDLLGEKVWMASLICVGIAIAGTLTSLPIRHVAVADPNLKLGWNSLGMPRDILQLLKGDRALLMALLVCSLFWMIGGIVQQTVNALGKTQLGLDDGPTAMMQASIGLGIAIGCILGGLWSREGNKSKVVKTGASGAVVTLILLALPGGENYHMLGFRGSIPVMILLGAFTGMFIVPIQVILQSRPPRDEKGRMIAAMNQCTWVGIILGAILFKVSIWVLDSIDLPRSVIFGITALVMLPIALCYRPDE
ncbi:MAG TPA: MFS transporter [Planctomycetaceae bacterium]|nr:MFS transporter [Planctomycetaceae bacterium]